MPVVAPATIPIRQGADKFNFTVAGLNAVQPPAQGRLYVYDVKTAGLCLCVTSAGSRTFYLYRRIEGIPKRIKLGKWPTMTIEGARKATLRLHGQVDVEGRDPAEERRNKRNETSFGELWNHYLENHLKAVCSPRSVQSDTSRWKWLEPWANRRLSTITGKEVGELHAKIGRESAGTNANRVIQIVRRLYNYAAKPTTFSITVPNPARIIDRFPETQRERFLQADELPRFFAALDAEPDELLRDFFAIALWTGARRTNVLEMRWDEINLAMAEWVIPASKFKTGRKVGREMKIALSPPALEILTRRKQTAINDWVFPGHGRTGHLVEPKLAWDRLLLRGGIQGLHLHDLRRTLGSWQAAAGSSLTVIGKSLGHVNAQTTLIYARLNLDTVRASVNAAAAAIQEAAHPTVKPERKGRRANAGS